MSSLYDALEPYMEAETTKDKRVTFAKGLIEQGVNPEEALSEVGFGPRSMEGTIASKFNGEMAQELKGIWNADMNPILKSLALFGKVTDVAEDDPISNAAVWAMTFSGVPGLLRGIGGKMTPTLAKMYDASRTGLGSAIAKGLGVSPEVASTTAQGVLRAPIDAFAVGPAVGLAAEPIMKRVTGEPEPNNPPTLGIGSSPFDSVNTSVSFSSPEQRNILLKTILGLGAATVAAKYLPKTTPLIGPLLDGGKRLAAFHTVIDPVVNKQFFEDASRADKFFGGRSLKEIFVPAVERMDWSSSRLFENKKVDERLASEALGTMSNRVSKLTGQEALIARDFLKTNGKSEITKKASLDQKLEAFTAIKPMLDTIQDSSSKLKGNYAGLLESKFKEKVSDLFVDVDDPVLTSFYKSLGPDLKGDELKGVLRQVIENPAINPVKRQLATDLYNFSATTTLDVLNSFREAQGSVLVQKIMSNPAWHSATPKPGWKLQTSGPLKDLWLERNIADGLGELEGAITIGKNTYNKYFLQPWKMAKVIMRFPTNFINAFGNFILNDINGTHPLSPLRMDVYGKAAMDMYRKAPEFKLFIKNSGVDPGTFASSELRPYVSALKYNSSMVDVLYSTLYGKAAKPFESFFNFNETLAKYAKFKWNKMQGMGNKDAALDAVKSTFDYSDVTNFTRKLRSSIQPFSTWQTKILTTFPEAVVKHPLRVAKYALIPMAIQAHALDKLNITESEFEQVKKDLPDYLKQGWVMLMPWRDDRGRLQMMNLTWMIPGLGDFAELSGSFDSPEGVINRTIQHPLGSLYANIIRNKTFSGAPIYNDWDSNSIKLIKIFGEIAKDIIPLVGDASRLSKTFTQDPSRLTPMQAIGSQFGSRIVPVDTVFNAIRANQDSSRLRRDILDKMQKEMQANPDESVGIRDKYLERYHRVGEE